MEDTGLSQEFINHIENIVRRINTNKEKLSIEPSYALSQEIFNAAKGQGYEAGDVKVALSYLYEQKRINWGHSINEKYFYCKIQKEE